MKYKVSQNIHQDKHQQSFSFKSRSWRNNPAILFLMLIVLVLSVRASWRVYINESESQKAADEKQGKLSELKDREAYLSDQLKSLSTSAGVESKLREKFGLGKPGENVAIIVEGTEGETAVSDTTLWQDIKNFFGGIFD